MAIRTARWWPWDLPGLATTVVPRLIRLTERPDWPAADTDAALLLNRRGGRLTTRAASEIFRKIAEHAGLEEDATAHVGWHTSLIRGGTDLVIVADLLGHARLDTVRTYTGPTAEERTKAFELLPSDR